MYEYYSNTPFLFRVHELSIPQKSQYRSITQRLLVNNQIYRFSLKVFKTSALVS
ncbi:hypothetical protein PPHE_a1938 [Pseudoalteromonas phenolica O-BC30]|nr:hypothetical protein [Pseudoalteromonas phenolica O-BC30]